MKILNILVQKVKAFYYRHLIHICERRAYKALNDSCFQEFVEWKAQVFDYNNKYLKLEKALI